MFQYLCNHDATDHCCQPGPSSAVAVVACACKLVLNLPLTPAEEQGGYGIKIYCVNISRLEEKNTPLQTIIDPAFRKSSILNAFVAYKTILYGKTQTSALN